MSPMTRFVLILLLLAVLCLPGSAFATWSVVALDSRTGQIVVASATCVTGANLERRAPPFGLRGLQAIVVPGKAAAAAQANVDATFANQKLIYAELQKGTEPKEIVRLLSSDPAFPSRQFGIIDMKGRAAGHSGTGNEASSLHLQGQAPGEPIYYSIQGNVLANDDVVVEAVKTFIATKGELTDRVMAAMEAADAKGGDRRCTCDTTPKTEAPCLTKTSHVAYILLAEKTDTNKTGYGDGDYAMFISVTERDIKPDEDGNPVKTLRLRYDAWKKARRP
jgi:uncharacterized Ntn-hydrolase superfamily protein